MDENNTIEKPIGIRIIRGILMALGLFLLNAVFVFGPYMGLWAVIVASVTSGIASVMLGLALIANYFIALPLSITFPTALLEYPTLMLLTGGFSLGIGGLLLSLFVWLAKYLAIGTGKYIKWHIKIIRGEKYE